LRREGGLIILAKRKRGGAFGVGSERGFSLAVSAPGFYRLKGMGFEVGARPPGAGFGESADAGEGAFFARLPFVLRPSFKDDRVDGAAGGKAFRAKPRGAATISAEDSLGVAAFIGRDGLLERKRGAPLAADAGFCAVRVSAGNGRSGPSGRKTAEPSQAAKQLPCV